MLRARVDARSAVAAPLRGIGQVLYAAGRFEEARARFDRALELDPNSAETCVDIGRTYEAEGKFTEAIAWQEKAIAIKPDNAGAHYSLAMMRRFDNVEARLRELERVLELSSLDDERRTTLHFTVARMYDEIGNHDTAFRHYKIGNDRRKTRQAYEPTEYSAFVDRVIASFSKALFDEKKGFGSELRRPVFIVGMMRSGTTLVEQILATHPEVYGHGELWSIRDLARALPERLGSGAPYPECVAALSPEMTHRLAGEHLARLERDAGEAVRSTDKLPHNFLRLGLISLLFPRAQLIHCTREPFDTCISCYFLYNVNAPFAHDLEFLGRFYRDYQRLMSHWRSTLPSPILDVPYEGLVANPEVWSRKIIDFLGLEWDDRCLAFYENERPVYTPSFWQVRQPIYASSIGRWRHYAKHLGPLFSALGKTPANGLDASIRLSLGQLDHEAVPAGFDAARQFGAELAVVEALIHVGQHGAPRTHPGDPRQGLRKMRVRRMRLAPEAVDDPQFDPFDCGERRLVEFGDVRRVRKATDPQAEGRAEAMVLRERDDWNPGDLERASDLMGYQGRFVISAGLGQGLEDIAKAPADLGQSLASAKSGRPPHQPVDRPQIIDPMQMVGMGMGHYHGVQPTHPGVDQLLAQIGRGINQDDNVPDLDQYRHPPAAVARIGGSHRPQSGPIVGTPVEAPQPRTVTFICGRGRLGEEAEEIVARRRREALRGDVLERRNRRRGRCHEGRLVALAAMGTGAR